MLQEITLYLILALLMAAALSIMLRPLAANPALPVKTRRRAAWSLGVFLFFGAFALYRLAGQPDILPLIAAREEKMAELKRIISQRASEIKSDPNNLGAWVELGQSFVETGQYQAASDAFRQAVLISGGKPVLILAYAKAQILTADGKVTDDAKRGLDMVMLQEPDNEEARYWLAVRQLQDGHTQEAMQAMKSLYRSLPAGSPLKAKIDRQIGRNQGE